MLFLVIFICLLSTQVFAETKNSTDSSPINPSVSYNPVSPQTYPYYPGGISPKIPGMPNYFEAKATFLGLEIRNTDLLILLISPILSLLGGLVFIVLEKDNKYESFRRKLSFIGSQLFASSVLGLVIALYFIGSISPDLSSISRLFGLIILLGYQAPRLWMMQEIIIKRTIEAKIKSSL